ncbi:hypothetical protein Zmor_011998 [Zophobas morio]|jgi:RNA recognition motif-containing protein|uniref:RRM domain-containing protein n=1 Tax=Zophobas morio TaxID=2755281 RepID=A0AA38HKS3_9CUCU|nr:hypothetical protein Zmor_011998 [Zophobas morio]
MYAAAIGPSSTHALTHCLLQTREEDLREYFRKYGPITDIFLPRDLRGAALLLFFFIPSNVLLGQYRGFGFVTYKNQEDAEDAAYKTDGREFDGRVLEVNIARMKVVAVLFPPYSLSR